jgi:protein-L-isoaspartate(D-aspartate) O-methyltransferase
VLFGGAVAEVPSEITAQLAENGRLVAVVKTDAGSVGRATLVTRTGGVVARRITFDASIPVLPGFAPRPAFVL